MTEQRLRIASPDVVPPAYRALWQTMLTLVNQGALSLASESGYVFALTDADGRMALGVRLDGTVEGKFLLPDSSISSAKLDPTLRTAFPTPIPDESGYAEVVTDADGRVARYITPAGEFGFYKLDAATLAYLTASLNLSATVAPQNFRDIKGATRPITSGPDIVCPGDSLTAGAGGSGATYPATLATLTGRTVRNRGVGGETSSGIAARMNGFPFLILPAGGQIPAAGGVTVTFTTSGPGYTVAYPLLQGSGGLGTGIPGTLGGVPGTLTLSQPSGGNTSHQADDVYTFTRTASGAAVPLARPAPFLVADAEARRDDIHVYWVGRNNTTDVERIVADLKAMIAHQGGLRPRFLVLSVTNGAGEGAGTSAYTNITGINTRLHREFGRRFLDVRRYLIDYGLQDAGITPTTQDTADVAADTIPVSLRYDGIHLLGPGYTIVAQQADARLRELEII